VGSGSIRGFFERVVWQCVEAAVYCNPYSIDDIKEKIEITTQVEKLRNDLRREGFKEIKKHKWNNVAK